MSAQRTSEGDAIARLFLAWLEFRKTHGIESARLACCGRTRELFDSLAEFERAFVQDVVIPAEQRRRN